MVAIVGPRLGTSAFNETGFREMSKARVAVRLVARPGALSQMIGRSVGFNLVVGWGDGRTTNSYGYMHLGMPYNTGSSGDSSWRAGSISGDTTFEGYRVTGGPVGANGVRTGMGVDYHLIIAGLKNAALNVMLQDGSASITVAMNYNAFGGQDCYKIVGDYTAWTNFMGSRVGKTLLVVIDRR